MLGHREEKLLLVYKAENKLKYVKLGGFDRLQEKKKERSCRNRGSQF